MVVGLRRLVVDGWFGWRGWGVRLAGGEARVTSALSHVI